MGLRCVWSDVWVVLLGLGHALHCFCLGCAHFVIELSGGSGTKGLVDDGAVGLGLSGCCGRYCRRGARHDGRLEGAPFKQW